MVLIVTPLSLALLLGRSLLAFRWRWRWFRHCRLFTLFRVHMDGVDDGQSLLQLLLLLPLLFPHPADCLQFAITVSEDGRCWRGRRKETLQSQGFHPAPQLHHHSPT